MCLRWISSSQVIFEIYFGTTLLFGNFVAFFYWNVSWKKVEVEKYWLLSVFPIDRFLAGAVFLTCKFLNQIFNLTAFFFVPSYFLMLFTTLGRLSKAVFFTLIMGIYRSLGWLACPVLGFPQLLHASLLQWNSSSLTFQAMTLPRLPTVSSPNPSSNPNVIMRSNSPPARPNGGRPISIQSWEQPPNSPSLADQVMSQFKSQVGADLEISSFAFKECLRFLIFCF